jgi:hypothetical protein
MSFRKWQKLMAARIVKAVLGRTPLGASAGIAVTLVSTECFRWFYGAASFAGIIFAALHTTIADALLLRHCDWSAYVGTGVLTNGASSGRERIV